VLLPAAFKHPVLVTGSPLAAAMLGIDRVVRGGLDVLRAYESPERTYLGRIAVVNPIPELRERFPTVELQPPAWSETMEEALYQRFDQFQGALIKQSQVADIALLGQAVECVILVVVDGLSYFEVSQVVGVEPCIVDGPTLTSFGYRNVLGNPPLAQRLFRKGFRRLLGFSYWGPDDNFIAQRFFEGLGIVIKVRTFDEVIERLARSNLRGTYVQIALSGLDQYAHSNRDAPLIEAELKRILDRIEQLTDVLGNSGVYGRLIMTSDHGVLWANAHSLAPKPESAFPGFSRRHSPTAVRLGQMARVFSTPMGSYTCLRYPFMVGRLRSNEWGVHGGISCYESLVPLLIREVGKQT